MDNLSKFDLARILEKDGYPTCMDSKCMSEKDLRKLPCGHLLCGECIETHLRKSSSFECPREECQRRCSGSIWSFPVATEAMERLRRMDVDRGEVYV
ncbi:hypothetical protein EB796_006334 [Bugula neritina]|uniref:Zinc finger RING-type eukaryotic domain-containing protein n=1 Tax=Bugula neritina TaxID=10212 RepID=A0A7J7KAS4_BUGNE|nr:hypothetical protein EB796_006334 [Bugula neritina]